MERLIEFIFNIRPSSWVSGGQWKLEWLSMPRHDMALLFSGAVVGVIWVVSLLYRREGRCVASARSLVAGLPATHCPRLRAGDAAGAGAHF